MLHWRVRDCGLSPSETKTFGRRLFWRDLAFFQSLAFPDIVHRGIRSHYDETEWTDISTEPGKAYWKAWRRGNTGFPILDAGMRELRATGWMSQSVRMVTASFLCEVLNIDWRHGEKHFFRQLVDADVSINAMMWQNAGRSGIDQWNFFSSPESGSQDPNGAYVKKWVPERARLPKRYIHKPWKAPPEELKKAGVVLGQTYPHRCVVVIKGARAAAKRAVLAMQRKTCIATTQEDMIKSRCQMVPHPEFTRRDLRSRQTAPSKSWRRERKNRGGGRRTRKRIRNRNRHFPLDRRTRKRSGAIEKDHRLEQFIMQHCKFYLDKPAQT